MLCVCATMQAEFNITDRLHAGEGASAASHSVAVRTYRYCDGSMLEDQDHWRLSGICRDVRLVALPSVAAISDFEVQATAAGHLSLVASVTSYAGSAPDDLELRGTLSRRRDCHVTDTLLHPY